MVYIDQVVIDPPPPIETGPWMLDPTMTYLNHASFGARPQAVYDAQLRCKRAFEASPIDFLDRERGDRIEAVRQRVAGFLGADPAGFGFVENATTGVGCVINSIDLHAGDEILTTTLVHDGVRKLLSKRAERVGGTYREIDIPLPVHDSHSITTRINDAISPATRVLVVDHVASTTSVIFPVKEIVTACRDRGILVLVDGAHGPGMLDLHIDEIDADWYVGNLHKWVCAPIGAGFVWTSEPYRSTTHPMTISHFLDMSYHEEFDWQGTRDISPWLASGVAVEWGGAIGWELIRQHNHRLAVWMQDRLVQEWGVDPLTPLEGSMIGNMVTVPLPSGFPHDLERCVAMRDDLYLNHRIEVPILFYGDLSLIRVSAQLYNRPEDLEMLIRAIAEKHVRV